MPQLSARHFTLFAITLLALFIRAYHLDALSLWYDEGATVAITLGGLPEWQKDVHPPLYYFLLYNWMHISGSDYWIRMLSVVFGAATIPIVYLIGDKMFGWKAGLIAGGLMAILPYHIRFSQEARMYTLMTFCFAVALWGLVIAVQEKKRYGWASYVVGMTLLAYSQGVGILYLGVLGAIFLILSDKPLAPRTWLPFILASSLVLIFFLPWMGFFAQTTKSIVQDYWISAPTLVDVTDVFRVFTVGEMISPSSIISHRFNITLPDWLGWAILLTPFLLAIGLAIKLVEPNQRRACGAVVTIIVLPTLLLYFVSLVLKPIFLARVLLPCTIGLVLLLASPWNNHRKYPPAQMGLIGIMALLLVMTDFYYYRYVNKQEWRAMASVLAKEMRANDVLFYYVDSSTGRYLLHRYDTTGRIARVREFSATGLPADCANDPTPCLETNLGGLPAGQRVWIIGAHEQFVPHTKQIATWLEQNLRLQREWPLYGIRLSLTQTP
jgi:mannosyltransferase